jgi:hypothetical protein
MTTEDATARREKWQTEKLEIAISRLAANLLRIMAGAGRTMDLARQLKEANELCQDVGGRSWHDADAAMQDGLEIRWPHVEGKTDADSDFNSEQHYLALIVTYASRTAAAKIESNGSEASKNERLLCQCISQYEKDRNERIERNLQSMKKRRTK